MTLQPFVRKLAKSDRGLPLAHARGRIGAQRDLPQDQGREVSGALQSQPVVTPGRVSFVTGGASLSKRPNVTAIFRLSEVRR